MRTALIAADVHASDAAAAVCCATGEAVFRVFLSHACIHLVPLGVLDCATLASLARTCRMARDAVTAPLACRSAAVRAAGVALYAALSIRWLIRPSARLDEFIRLGLFDDEGSKLAEIKLSRVIRWTAPHVIMGVNGAVLHHQDDGIATRSIAVAMWRCSTPWPRGGPRQVMAPRLMEHHEAVAALIRLVHAGFVPLRRKGFYCDGDGEPLWGRP